MAFIPPTEHCNLMPMSDNWVIENVLKQLDKNKIDTVYAVNLSGQSLIDNKSTQHTTYNIQHTTYNRNLDYHKFGKRHTIPQTTTGARFFTALDDCGNGLYAGLLLCNNPSPM